MSRGVAIIAALPREVSGLVKGWKVCRRGSQVTLYTKDSLVVACAGMGAARTAIAVQAARELMPLSVLLSAGLAGACDPALKLGDIVRAGIVIDSRTGERFSGHGEGSILVAADSIAGVREKARLRSAYGAAAVDMESAAVARMAEAHGLRFSAVKAISDEADFELGDLSRFAAADGQFRTGAFAMHAAMRPHKWSGLVALARNSGRAVRSLADAIEAELAYFSRFDN